jgi:hypothetical protein
MMIKAHRLRGGRRQVGALRLSLLKKPSGHEIGVPMKVTLDDI